MLLREVARGSTADQSSLRRRFTQNQEDCTFTVLALLPTVADNILEALPVESITFELQQQRQARLGQSVSSPSEISSNASGEDGRSLSSFKTESFVHTSQMAASAAGSSESPRPKKTKSQLWGELKISSITRSLTLIYTAALLNILTRIQLNLLGRRSYVLSVVALASQGPTGPAINLENVEETGVHGTLGSDFQTNRSYLAFSWWLIHRGWREIRTRVEAAVEEVFAPINPREELSFERLTRLILDTRKRIEGSSPEERRNQKWLPYLLPPADQQEFVLREAGILASVSEVEQHHLDLPKENLDPQAPLRDAQNPQTGDAVSPTLRRLLDETSDVVESPRFTYVTTRLLDALFSELTDAAIRTQAFRLSEPALSSSLTAETVGDLDSQPESPRIKLANVLAVITRQAHAIGNGMPNVYMQAMEQVKELESLAVVIFSSDSDLEEVSRAQQDAPSPTLAAVPEQAGPAGVDEPKASGSRWGLFESIWQKAAS